MTLETVSFHFIAVVVNELSYFIFGYEGRFVKINKTIVRAKRSVDSNISDCLDIIHTTALESPKTVEWGINETFVKLVNSAISILKALSQWYIEKVVLINILIFQYIVAAVFGSILPYKHEEIITKFPFRYISVWYPLVTLVTLMCDILRFDKK